MIPWVASLEGSLAHEPQGWGWGCGDIGYLNVAALSGSESSLAAARVGLASPVTSLLLIHMILFFCKELPFKVVKVAQDFNCSIFGPNSVPHLHRLRWLPSEQKNIAKGSLGCFLLFC